MSLFYARNGEEITLEQWGPLMNDIAYKRVAMDTFPSGRWVSTVWLGMDHSFSFDGKKVPPLIFETMVFDGTGSGLEEDLERYSTEEQAREGHQRIVAMVRELENVVVVEEDHDAR